MSITSIPAAGPTILDPERTVAVLAIKAEIVEMLDWFADELDQWTTGREAALQDARDKLISLIQRLDALKVLGPPSQEALDRLRAAYDA